MRASDLLFLFFFAAAMAATSAAFIFNGGKSKHTAFPGLERLTEKQQGASLKISLVIKKPCDTSLAKFALEGLEIDLRQERLAAKAQSNTGRDSIQMPVANGPNSQLSSGKRALTLRQSPSFIGLKGTQTVKLENACWELVWREGDIAGNLICGFDVPNEVRKSYLYMFISCSKSSNILLYYINYDYLQVQRNRKQALLPKGRLYLAFLVWTEAELEKHHSKMYNSENLANAHLSKSYSELDQFKFASANHNWIQKAIHYQAARKAHDDYLQHHRKSSDIWQMTPLESNLKRMDSGLLVLTKGTAWIDNKDAYVLSGGNKHVVLGRALIRR
jgi:hypothetical protein